MCFVAAFFTALLLLIEETVVVVVRAIWIVSPFAFHYAWIFVWDTIVGVIVFATNIELQRVPVPVFGRFDD